jgi:hypothetical protein
MPSDRGATVTFAPDLFAPLIRQVVEATLAHLEEVRATLPDTLAFSEPEAARLLSLRQHQLRDARLRGEIKASVGPARKILYRREDLIEYLMTRRWSGDGIGLKAV